MIWKERVKVTPLIVVTSATLNGVNTHPAGGANEVLWGKAWHAQGARCLKAMTT